MVDIRAERGKLYGDPQEMHANVAAVWTAQLRARYGQHMPELDANVAELMLAGFKVLRASRPVPTALETLKQWLDSPADAKVYLDFAAESVATPRPDDPESLTVTSTPDSKFPTCGARAGRGASMIKTPEPRTNFDDLDDRDEDLPL